MRSDYRKYLKTLLLKSPTQKVNHLFFSVRCCSYSKYFCALPLFRHFKSPSSFIYLLINHLPAYYLLFITYHTPKRPFPTIFRVSIKKPINPISKIPSPVTLTVVQNSSLLGFLVT